MKLDFDKSDGLITAVIQDHQTGRVLMVGYMNEEAFEKTVETGFATFYSRSRKKLWLKGESSGHRLVVKEISTDCDLDAVLVQRGSAGPGRVPRRLPELLFPAAGERRVGDVGSARLRSDEVYGGKTMKLKLGIPKGSLENATIDLFRRAGLQHHYQQPLLLPGHRRSGDRVHADPRAGDGALRRGRHPRRGAHRPGLDAENEADVEAWPTSIYAKQSFGKVRWVLAVPEASPFQSREDLQGKIIATELVATTRRYLARTASPRRSSSVGAPPK